MPICRTPELLPEMIRLMDDGVGADVVYGQRVKRDGETWFKRLSATVFYRLLLRLTDVWIPPDTGDFRLMKRPVLEALLAMPEQQRFIRGMVACTNSAARYRWPPRRPRYPCGEHRRLGYSSDLSSGGARPAFR
jgi:hypothetical protein